MKKNIILILILSILSVGAVSAQKKKLAAYGIGFYNVENLFDTEYNEEIDDIDFTPQGAHNWTLPKYQKKLENISYVMDKLGKEYLPAGLAVIGVAEVENRKVLEDLVKTEPMSKTGYRVVHYDSPDRRGIDVGLLYDPAQFKVTASKIYPYIHPTDTAFKTRDQLLVSGILADEPVHVIVAHWPSRYGGERSIPSRARAAEITKHIVDSLYKDNADAKVIFMGDLNDDPVDSSVSIVLDAKRHQKDVKKGGLFNTMWEFYDKGIGSLGYKGQWNLFDQIIVSEPLLGNNRSTLKFWKAEIFNRDFLIEKTGKNKGYPHRTFRENTFINGYSDHFPTLIYLVKEL